MDSSKQLLIAESEALIKRAFIFLESGEWEKANEYLEKTLDKNPENPYAYVGRIMASFNVSAMDGLAGISQSFEDTIDFKMAMEYGDEELRKKLISYSNIVKNRRCDIIYATATDKLNSAKSAKDFTLAADMFDSIPQWKNAKDNATICREKAKEQGKKKKVFIIAFIIALLVFSAAAVIALTILSPKDKEDGKKADAEVVTDATPETPTAPATPEAPDAAVTLASPEASATSATSALDQQYNSAVSAFNNKKYADALPFFFANRSYKDSASYIKKAQKQLVGRISAGDYHTVGIKSNGTVVSIGRNNEGQCNVSGWSNIVAVAAADYHTVGLKSDGIVVATGGNERGQCNVSGWSNIVAVAAGGDHTVGLKSDGTVVAVGSNGYGQCNVSGWSDIVAVAASDYHTVGLKADGTVVAVGSNEYGQCNVSGWSDIVAISACYHHTVGLKSDGTVVAVGANGVDRCQNNPYWTDIVAISSHSVQAIAIKADGTAITVGLRGIDGFNVTGWTDIVAADVGDEFGIGLKADGTLVAVNYRIVGFPEDYGQCNVYGWNLFK